jgi:hypothetical protein
VDAANAMRLLSLREAITAYLSASRAPAQAPEEGRVGVDWGSGPSRSVYSCTVCPAHFEDFHEAQAHAEAHRSSPTPRSGE